MSDHLNVSCPACGTRTISPVKVVVYASRDKVEKRKFQLGYRCPRCQELRLQGVTRDGAQGAVDRGSICVWGSEHPLEVTEREEAMRRRFADPYTWDEYLDKKLIERSRENAGTPA